MNRVDKGMMRMTPRTTTTTVTQMCEPPRPVTP